jgi:hypothetical protein
LSTVILVSFSQPVAQPDKLFMVGGGDEHGGALRGGLVDELVDV